MIVKNFLMRGKALQPDLLGDKQTGLFVPIGDVQWGAPDFPEGKFTDFLHWVVDRNGYLVGMGDFMDFSSFTDRRTMAPLRDSTREVLDGMIRDKLDKLIKMVAFTKGRWVGFLEGNHRWTFRDGHSTEQYIAAALGSDFLGTMAFLRLIPEGRPKKAHDADTIVCLHHGYGGARTAGPRLINLERLVEGWEADLYLMGHDHSDVHESTDRMYCSPPGAKQVMYRRRKVFARTGNWMRSCTAMEPQPIDAPASDSRGGYAEEKAFTPKAIGAPFFVLGYDEIDKTGYYRPLVGYGRF